MTATDVPTVTPPSGEEESTAAVDPASSPAADQPDAARPGRRWHPSWHRLVSPLALLVIWQIVGSAGLVSSRKLPPPATVWSEAVKLATQHSSAYGTLQGAISASVQRIVIGFLIGAVAAVALAIVAGLSRVGEYGVDPIMQMVRTVPLFGLIPVFIVWFGIGEGPKLLLIALATAIPLYLNTFSGIRSIESRFGELARVLGLSRVELLRHVVLPGALPQTLVGLRQALGTAWLALVVAEQLNTHSGLGFMINQASQFLQNDVIIVALLVYTILGLITDSIVRFLERRALAWQFNLIS